MTHQYIDAAKAYDKAFSITQVGPVATKLHWAQTNAGNAKDAAYARIQQWLTAHPEEAQVRQHLVQNLGAFEPTVRTSGRGAYRLTTRSFQ